MPEMPQPRTIKDPIIGTTIDGRYRILAAIGRGATSSVYKAESVVSGGLVALKMLHPHLASDESLVARFEREALAAKILTHPNIVAVQEYAISDAGSPYLLMDFIDGISLQQLLAREGWLPADEAIPIFTQICAALNVAHQKGVVHRDLKPGNIMLVPRMDGKYLVKLLDFGCAQMVPMLGETVMKRTQTGEMLGSLLYMSPEQCMDGDVDGRSDCYSLGCVLYETLTGKPPLAARTAFETMNKQLSVMPDSLQHVRPDLTFDKGLEKAIFKAVAKSPAKRYQQITDFMDDLIKVAPAGSSLERGGASHRQRDLGLKAEASVGRLTERGEKTGDDKVHENELDKIKLLEKDTAYGAGQLNLSGDPLSPPTFSGPMVLLIAVFGMAVLILLFTLFTKDFLIILSLMASAGALVSVSSWIGRKRLSYVVDSNVRRSEPAIVYKKQDLAGGLPEEFLSSLRPINHEKILILSARRLETSRFILEIKTSDQTNKSIAVEPLEPNSFFWETFCAGIPSGGKIIEFPVSGQIVNAAGKKMKFVAIKSHLAAVRDWDYKVI